MTVTIFDILENAQIPEEILRLMNVSLSGIVIESENLKDFVELSSEFPDNSLLKTLVNSIYSKQLLPKEVAIDSVKKLIGYNES